MGMFDDLRCEVEIPGDPKPQHCHFQTKDFDCFLDKYTITAAGTLEKYGVAIPFHGLLRFYTFEDDRIKRDGTDGGLWFEYEAKFTDGQLQGIEVVEIHRTEFGGPITILSRRAAVTVTPVEGER